MTDLLKNWGIMGAAAGVGFGLFAAPLLYLLVKLYFGDVTIGSTIKFALGNALTWGVFGLIAGNFFSIINRFYNPTGHA